MLGYWIFHNSFTQQSLPTESDVVLYYLHGGAYCINQPGHFMPFLLVLVDSLQQRGVKASIFALDYALAPEAPFEQAANEY
jgi:acetyl esterase/lipase